MLFRSHSRASFSYASVAGFAKWSTSYAAYVCALHSLRVSPNSPHVIQGDEGERESRNIGAVRRDGRPRAAHALSLALQSPPRRPARGRVDNRSEEHTSELQSLMRISYAVFCLKKKKIQQQHAHDQAPNTSIEDQTHK